MVTVHRKDFAKIPFIDSFCINYPIIQKQNIFIIKDYSKEI